MAKIVIEFRASADKELNRLSGLLGADKAEVLRRALNIYSLVVNELTKGRGKTKRLALIRQGKVIATIAVPGLKN